MSISPLAVVGTARIGADVTIHPFAVIGPDATIGAGVTIHPHAVLEGPIEIGDAAEILPGAHLGRLPSRSRAVSREPGAASLVRIGARTCIGSHSVIYTDVQIGADTMIGDGVSIREGNRIGDRCVLGRYVTVNYDSKIEDGAKYHGPKPHHREQQDRPRCVHKLSCRHSQRQLLGPRRLRCA